MRILKKEREITAFLIALEERAFGVNPEIEERVRSILDDVRKHNDRAVIRYARAFDSLKTDRFSLTPEEISRHAERADPKVVKALNISAKRIRAFHEKQKEECWFYSEKDAVLGQIIKPL
jgi:histidinol dehydrogenase